MTVVVNPSPQPVDLGMLLLKTRPGCTPLPRSARSDPFALLPSLVDGKAIAMHSGFGHITNSFSATTRMAWWPTLLPHCSILSGSFKLSSVSHLSSRKTFSCCTRTGLNPTSHFNSSFGVVFDQLLCCWQCEHPRHNIESSQILPSRGSLCGCLTAQCMRLRICGAIATSRF